MGSLSLSSREYHAKGHPTEPICYQRRLAKPGRGGEQRQLAMQARVQPLDQARPRHQLRPDRRSIELCGQQLRTHLSATIIPCWLWGHNYPRARVHSESVIGEKLNPGRLGGCIVPDLYWYGAAASVFGRLTNAG